MHRTDKKQTEFRGRGRSASIRTREELVTQIRLHLEEITSLGVKRIGIFGSWATNEHNEESDIDFVIEFKRGKATFKTVAAVVDFLEGLLGRRVDILTPEAIDAIRIPNVRDTIKRQILYV